MSKGSRDRTTSKKAYDEGFDMIKRKRKDKKGKNK